MIHYNTAVVLVGTSLLGASAGLMGSFAVLRRRSLTGDALAHAALPGLCLAFLIVGAKSLPAMLAGALITGLVGVAVIALLCNVVGVREDAAVGIVLSVFFGAGIVLSRLIQNRDSEGGKAGLDSYILGKTSGMLAQDVWIMAALSLAGLLVVGLLYKELQLVIFDPAFAKAQGLPAGGLDLLLMGMIAVTVVVGLPAVGVVLISALLILPGAAARFWVERLDAMLGLSALFGVGVGLAGTTLSAQFSGLPAGPILVLVGSGLFFFSMFFAPRRGVIAAAIAGRMHRAEVFRRRILEQHLSAESGEAPPDGVDDGMRRLRAVRSLERSGDLVQTARNEWALTDQGRARAKQAALYRRLWTALLNEEPSLAAVFAENEDRDPRELLSPDQIERLQGRLEEFNDLEKGAAL
jgi:manganese/zinc/iron transport system permease protein